MKSTYILVLLLGLVLFGCVGAPPAEAPQDADETTEPVVYNVTPETEEPVEEPETEVDETEDETEETDEETEETEETDELSEIESEEISFRTQDQWEIYATIYYAKETDGVWSPDSAIVLLHELGADRSSYDSLIPVLHEKFPDSDVVALDIRGHGKSTNHGTYERFGVGDFKGAKYDVVALKSELGTLRPTIENYYLVGASMGSSIAIKYAAEEGGVKRVVMLSPGTAYQNFDITENIEDYDFGLFMAVASDDHYSAGSASELYSISGSDPKELKTYYGISAHGTNLLEATADDSEPLEDMIVEWLKR